MAESTTDKIKFRILKAIDISGFTLFDPIVRLLFGEEPNKQLERITKSIIVPILFVGLCIGVWSWVGPRHKTKSGEVPTPDIVWNSVIINDTIADREKIKEEDFLASGKERLARIQQVQAEKAALEAQVALAQEDVKAAEIRQADLIKGRVAPLQENYDKVRDQIRDAGNARDAAIKALAEQVAAKQASRDDLLAALREDSQKTTEERASLTALKAEIDEIRSVRYGPLRAARAKFDSDSDRLLFLNTRLEILDSRNLSLKVEESRNELAEHKDTIYAAESGREVLAAAKKAIRAEESIERFEGQTYASAVTIYHQIKRSLFTVFVGFFMAAAVAIPVGILCGLSPIFMAAMTPIISVFKPVSPVVWLLIFQIVVGAFFPDPENHPLFNFLAAIPFVRDLQVNPALVFSACTVAMCAVWPSLVNTALGVASIDKDHLNVARVLRLGFWDRLIKIIIPSALPLVFAGLRISLGVGWMVLIAAEALSSSDGLGKFVWDEYQNGSSLTFANIIMVCFVVGIIGFFLDRMMIVFQRLVSFDGAPSAV